MKNTMATAASVKTSAAKQKKIDTVSSLTDKLSRAHAIVLADYRGLKHKQLEELRKGLKKLEAEFVVTKNTLLKRALTRDDLTSYLKEATGTLFAYADEVSPLKELLKFFKTAGAGKPKAGLLGNTVLSDADITKLASLPNRQTLLAQLVGQLNAPIQGLHYALSWNLNRLVWAINAIKNTKS